MVSANVIKHFICAFKNCLFYEWGLPFHSAKYRFPITYAMWWNYFQYWMHPFMWKGFQIFILGVFVAGILGMRLWKQFTLLFCRFVIFGGGGGSGKYLWKTRNGMQRVSCWVREQFDTGTSAHATQKPYIKLNRSAFYLGHTRHFNQIIISCK